MHLVKHGRKHVLVVSFFSLWHCRMRKFPKTHPSTGIFDTFPDGILKRLPTMMAALF